MIIDQKSCILNINTSTCSFSLQIPYSSGSPGSYSVGNVMLSKVSLVQYLVLDTVWVTHSGHVNKQNQYVCRVPQQEADLPGHPSCPVLQVIFFILGLSVRLHDNDVFKAEKFFLSYP